jgi:hypothetical protein
MLCNGVTHRDCGSTRFASRSRRPRGGDPRLRAARQSYSVHFLPPGEHSHEGTRRLEAKPKPPGREATNRDGGATRPAGTGLPAYKRLQIVVDDKALPVHHPAYTRPAPAAAMSSAVGQE